MIRPRRLIAPLAAAALLVSSAASAQWYAGIAAGTNHTSSADVSVSVPGQGLAITYADVAFAAKPLKSPQYYIWRVGHFFGAHGRIGLELEFTHLKVIGQTGRTYAVSGTVDGGPLAAGQTQAMNTLVGEYQMTHGLNFALINVVSRTPIGSNGRVDLVVRGGAGPTIPHAESEVLGVAREQYQYAGVGVQGAAGVGLHVSPRVTITADYKLSWAKPRINVAGGTGETRALTQQFAVGIAFGAHR